MAKYIMSALMFVFVVTVMILLCRVLHLESFVGLSPVLAIWITMEYSGKTLDWTKNERA